MRRAIVLVLPLTLSGCAAQRGHVAHGADSLHDWASVVTLPRGTPVRATFDYEIDGRLDEVTDSMLTIRVPPDMHRMRIDRARMARVAVLTQKKMPWRWLAKPLTVGVVGGLMGALAGAVLRNAEVAATSLEVFVASSIGWFYHFSHHYFDHEWRIVYVRP